MQLPNNFGKLDPHDLKVILFHMLIAAIQTYLIGLKIENPVLAPAIQTISEMLRRIIV